MADPNARKAAPMMLTVIIYDGFPLRWLNETPTHRTVHVRLTPEQCEAIALIGEDEGYGQTYVEPVVHAEVAS